MFGSMLRRLLRRPLFLVTAGVLLGANIGGGAVILVREDFRDVVDGGGGSLAGTVIGGCEIKPRAQCPNANLSGAVLKGVSLIEANLSGANLNGADLREARLMRANLSRANLSGANLASAYLEKANLSGAGLANANLSGADMRTVSLGDTDLNGANLTGANAAGANLNLAKLCGTTMPNGSVNDEGCSSASGPPPLSLSLPTQQLTASINGTFTFNLNGSPFDSWRVAQDFDPPIVEWQGTQRSPGAGGVTERWTYKATAPGKTRARLDLPNFDMGGVDSSMIIEVTVK